MASVHYSRYIRYGESLQFSNYAAQTALPYQIASLSARQKQKQGNSRGAPTPGHLHVSPLRLAPLLHAGAAAKSLLPRPPIRQYLLVLPLANLAAEVSFYFFNLFQQSVTLTSISAANTSINAPDSSRNITKSAHQLTLAPK